MTQGEKVLVLWIFIRKKKNRYGTTSIIVASKFHGIFKEIKTIGVSDSSDEIEVLITQAHQWISNYKGELDIFQQSAKEEDERQVIEYLFSNI